MSKEFQLLRREILQVSEGEINFGSRSCSAVENICCRVQALLLTVDPGRHLPIAQQLKIQADVTSTTGVHKCLFAIYS
jgi:hypothetical protein